MLTAVTSSVLAPLQRQIKRACCVVTDHLNVLSVLMKYKHLHANDFIQKVITSVRNVDSGYIIIWGSFTKVKARKNSCYALDSACSGHIGAVLPQ